MPVTDDKACEEVFFRIALFLLGLRHSKANMKNLEKRFKNTMVSDLVFDEPPRLSDPRLLEQLTQHWGFRYSSETWARRIFMVLAAGIASMLFLAESHGEGSLALFLKCQAFMVGPSYLVLYVFRRKLNRRSQHYSDWSLRGSFNVCEVSIRTVRTRSRKSRAKYSYRWVAPSGVVGRSPLGVPPLPPGTRGYIAVNPADPTDSLFIGLKSGEVPESGCVRKLQLRGGS